jgi:hypothetical protein
MNGYYGKGERRMVGGVPCKVRNYGKENWKSPGKRLCYMNCFDLAKYLAEQERKYKESAKLGPLESEWDL